MKPSKRLKVSRAVVMSTSSLSGNGRSRAQLKVYRPGDLRRIKEQRATEEVRVLNVQPVDEDENEFDSSMNIPTVISHAGGETVEEELGNDDWEECADIYQELLDGCRQM